MTYADASNYHPRMQLNPRRAYDGINNFFGGLRATWHRDYVDFEGNGAESERSPREGRLEEIQNAISSVSMHLPRGFAPGLNRQFADMLADDAWEDGDAFPTEKALAAFLNMLISTRAAQRPGIGTNGRGSITAFWRDGENRLTVDCLPTGNIRWVLSRVNQHGDLERAAAECQPERLLDVLDAYRPEVWFG